MSADPDRLVITLELGEGLQLRTRLAHFTVFPVEDDASVRARLERLHENVLKAAAVLLAQANESAARDAGANMAARRGQLHRFT